MKVKMLRRDNADYLRETKHDIHKIPRNFHPDAHPHDAGREYVRALNAVKLERVFAKPFMGVLDGHGDAVSALALHGQRLTLVASSAADGQIRFWDLMAKKTLIKAKGHDRFTRGITFDPKGQFLWSVGDDKTVKSWKIADVPVEPEPASTLPPHQTFIGKKMMTGLSHQVGEPILATCGENTALWNTEMQTVVREYQWGVDSIHDIKFNPTETHILGACASDRSIMLYDVRERNPMRKVIMELRSNQMAWNPMEPFVFAVANEDYNVYSFDIRSLKKPLMVHMDHTAAVIALDYAPTGKEIVAGSYDKTIRIFKSDEGHSREVYHTKRMQRLTCVAWTKDNKYILSGSDEMNIRIWKAKAWEKLGPMKDRQKSALNYNEKLKEKFGSHPQVKRIARHRQVPKHVMNARKEHQIIRESKKRKEANRRQHSKPGTVPYVPERDKHVIEEKE